MKSADLLFRCSRSRSAIDFDGATGVREFANFTEPRSGSNYLCKVLTSTGQLGRPLKYFNGPARRTFDDPHYPDDVDAQLTYIRKKGATSNGVYGLKLFSSQFDLLMATPWIARLPGLHFIRLERRDILGQAISWLRADQTGAYRAYSKTTGAAAHYDRRSISRRMEMIQVGHARWRLFFARNGIRFLSLLYEEIVADPAAPTRDVAAFLGEPLTLPCSGAAVDLSIQGDELSLRWRERFLAESANQTALPRIRNHPETFVSRQTRRLAACLNLG